MSFCDLTNETTINDRSESVAVGYAASALRRDLRRKLGLESETSRHSGAPCIELRLDEANDAFDAHTIEVKADGVTIIGSDELGLIHGIYAFSEQWLEGDPCQYFTEIVPSLTTQVEIPCRTTESEPYTFRHRGFFFNDEDLLVGFQMEKPEHGFSMDLWRELLELALRMQCTCVIPGTNILPDEPQIKLASDMGLYIAQHHAEPLGATPFFWPRGVPFSWTSDREQILRYWRKGIERQVGKRVLWTINFRGLLDRPFWVDDPNLSPDAPLETKARIINEALAAQVDLVREIRGEESPEIFGYLWGELHEIYNAGLLNFPEGTTIIHTDDGDACMRTNLEELVGKSAERTGVYEHISMFNGAQSMRVTSYAPRIFARELKRVVDLGMTEICILNVANIREKIFNLRQVAGYVNHYEAMVTICGDDGEGYFDWYAAQVPGVVHPEVTAAYRALTEIPFPFDDANPDNTVGDNFYTMVVRFTLQQIYNHEDAAPAIFHMVPVDTLREAMDWAESRFGDSEPKWAMAAERAHDAAKHLVGNRRTFFENEAIAQLDKVLSLTRMVLAFSRSVTHYLDGRGYDAYLQAYQALRHVEEALDVEKRIEVGKFKDWHRNDLNCRTWKCRDFLTTWHAMLNDLRWLNLDGMAEGPQPCYASYKYNPNFPTTYRTDLFTEPER
ncbi:MAG: glycosyl hydrolase 115 family protein [Kiritimatiellia bacterium]|jgi:hypothetical protein|nr:glycosyl hydrolase 115 family protein [Kiritimatiellia bacterium]MDP6810910.1 glycosyl hydrolase 115 family protein [Kiritimatiellia bacterium]MDP7023372.1 glycosyl hydrolase 115 family protein [Kiritimatiellia bacterium]